MAGGGEVEDHDPLSSGSYSQLLLSDDESCINFASAAFSSDQNAPKMLYFGPDDHFNKEKCDLFFNQVSTKLAQKTAGVTCSGGVSHPSPAASNAAAAVPTPGKTTHDKKNAAAAGAGRSNPAGKSAPAAAARDIQRSSKKAKVSDGSSETTPRHAKVKKEKLGERIIALQQLVSPFGKTDTASVLHEATGYIKFLQGQVQALCSPYLQRLPSPAHLQDHEKEKEGEVEGGETGKDLRSKGLCLVPADLTAHVAEANGADLWTPATMLYKISSANSSR